MPKSKKDPFVQLVEDLLKFTPDFRARAMALAAMHDSAPVPPTPPQAKSIPPKPTKAPVVQAKPKKRGRKKGSKNKPKAVQADPTAESFHQAAEQV